MSFYKYLFRRFAESPVGGWICFGILILLCPIWIPILIVWAPIKWYRKVKADYHQQVIDALKNK